VGIAESLRRGEGFEPISRPQGGWEASGQPPWSDEDALGADGRRRRAVPGTRPVAHGIPARIPKLRAIGNSIVPQVAAAFISAYIDFEIEVSRS
jgi:DNA (cytosine-5)-methyltransferase 1